MNVHGGLSDLIVMAMKNSVILTLGVSPNIGVKMN
jgi:hypothetical protein